MENTCNMILSEKIIDKENYLPALFNMIPDAISITRKDNGKCVEVNNGFINLFGFSELDIIDKTTLELGIWKNKKDRELLLKEIEKNKYVNDREFCVNNKFGNDIFVLISCQIFIVDEVEYILTIAKDITKIKEDQIKILKSAKELEYKNHALEEFVYVASHDLQEPLRIVSNYCQLIQEIYDGLDKKNINSKDKSEMDTYIRYVLDATSRMRFLIKDLLDFSKVGKDELNYEHIELRDLIETVLFDFKVKMNENKCKVTIDKMPKIYAQKTQISQIFHNLISNAIKFKGYAPLRIHIGVEEHGDMWKFSVSDNGIGIEQKHLKYIFGLFKRLHDKQKYPGTGIGLALVKKIVELYGGEIWVESKYGKGSAFYFTLPKK